MKKVTAITLIWSVFLVFSYYSGWRFGIETGKGFLEFLTGMLMVLPPAFILVGLFEVWVEPKTVEAQFGKQSGARGYIWAVILAGASVGGLLTALPLGCALYKKGARLSVVFTYFGASSVARIPMTLFEASFIGLTFSLIRLGVSLPLIFLSSLLMESWLQKQSYVLPEQKQTTEALSNISAAVPRIGDK